MDATKEDSIEAAIAEAGAKWGRIDGCVNCAGVGMGKSTVNRKGVPHSMKSFEFIIRLNLLGTFSVLSKCAAWMVKNDPDENGERGTIINVASVAATDGQNGQAAYSASKAGVVGMVRKKINDIFLLLFICLLLIRSLSSFNDRHFQLHVI
jgi:3-hydroxyacyl-CoA dehydrogenase/3-hydroxy-2-methylbutyryl-CoA dehydrogenase